MLLGTTALVAAGALAAPAHADDPVALGLGGYYRTAIGAILDDDNDPGNGGVNNHDYYHEQDVEVHFQGKTTLDNGLTVGLRVELEGQTQAGDQIDEVWAYVSGNWGELRVGDEDDVAYAFAVIAPYVGIFGNSDPELAFSNAGFTPGNALGSATNNSALNFYGDTSKLYYTSPKFSGFQLGVSYAPDQSQDTRSNPGGPFGGGPVVGNSAEDIWSAGLRYEDEFDAVSVKASAGYVRGSDEGAAGIDGDGVGFGLNLGFDGFKVGGSYQWFHPDNVVADYDVWDVGVTYAWGAWGVGAGFTRSTIEGGAGLDEDENNVFLVGAAYTMGPGISLSGAFSYDDFENNAAGGVGPDYNAVSAMLGLYIDY
jgi:predicted porin